MASNKDAPVLFALPAPRSIGKGLLCLCRKVFWQSGDQVHFVYAPVSKTDAVELLKDPNAVKLLNNPNDDLLTIAPNGAIIGVQQTVGTPPPTISHITPTMRTSVVNPACITKPTIAKSHVPIKPRLRSPKEIPLSSNIGHDETVTLSLAPTQPATPSEAEHAPSTSPDLPQSSKTQARHQIPLSTCVTRTLDTMSPLNIMSPQQDKSKDINSPMPKIKIETCKNKYSSMLNTSAETTYKDTNSTMPKISAVFSLAKTYTPVVKGSCSPADVTSTDIQPLDLRMNKSSLDGSLDLRVKKPSPSKTPKDKPFSKTTKQTYPNNVHFRRDKPSATVVVKNSPAATIFQKANVSMPNKPKTATVSTPPTSFTSQATSTTAVRNSPTATVVNFSMSTVTVPNSPETVSMPKITHANSPTPVIDHTIPTDAVQRSQATNVAAPSTTITLNSLRAVAKPNTPLKNTVVSNPLSSDNNYPASTDTIPNSSTTTTVGPNKSTPRVDTQNTLSANIVVPNPPTLVKNSKTSTVAVRNSPTTPVVPNISSSTIVAPNTPSINVKVSNTPPAVIDPPTTPVTKQTTTLSIKSSACAKDNKLEKPRKRKLSEGNSHKGNKKQRISIINGSNPLKLKFAWKKTPKKSIVSCKRSKDNSPKSKDNSSSSKSPKFLFKEEKSDVKSRKRAISDLPKELIRNADKTMIREKCITSFQKNSKQQDAEQYGNEDVPIKEFNGTNIVIVNGPIVGYKFRKCAGLISINGSIPRIRLHKCENRTTKIEKNKESQPDVPCIAEANYTSDSHTRLSLHLNTSTQANTKEKSNPPNVSLKSNGTPRGRPPKNLSLHHYTPTKTQIKEECSFSITIKGTPRGRPPKNLSLNLNTPTETQTKEECNHSLKIKGTPRGRPPKIRIVSHETAAKSQTKKECQQVNDLSGSLRPKGRGRPPKSRSLPQKYQTKQTIPFQPVPSIETLTRHPDFNSIPTNNKVEYLKELLRAQRAAMGID